MCKYIFNLNIYLLITFITFELIDLGIYTYIHFIYLLLFLVNYALYLIENIVRLHKNLIIIYITKFT